MIIVPKIIKDACNNAKNIEKCTELSSTIYSYKLNIDILQADYGVGNTVYTSIAALYIYKGRLYFKPLTVNLQADTRCRYSLYKDKMLVTRSNAKKIAEIIAKTDVDMLKVIEVFKEAELIKAIEKL